MEDTLGLLFLGLTPCQQYFRYIKVTYHRIVLPVRSLGLGKMCCMRGVLQLFQKSPFFKNVVEQTARTFLELFWNCYKIF